jgi:hypothetical protein
MQLPAGCGVKKTGLSILRDATALIPSPSASQVLPQGRHLYVLSPRALNSNLSCLDNVSPNFNSQTRSGNVNKTLQFHSLWHLFLYILFRTENAPKPSPCASKKENCNLYGELAELHPIIEQWPLKLISHSFIYSFNFLIQKLNTSP